MKKRLACIYFALLTVSCLLILPPKVSAVGVSVRASSSAVKPGGTFSVTVSFSGENIFGVDANFSYDSSLITFISGSNASNGKIVIAGTGPGAKSLSTTLNFKANAVGTATISVNCNSSYDFDLNQLGGGSRSVSVTISETATNTTTNQPKEPINKREIAAQIGGLDRFVWHAIPNTVKAPEGFAKKKVTYQEKSIDAFQSEGGTTLVYLTDADGNEAALVLLDMNTGMLTPYQPININASYILLPRPENAEGLPEGYVEALVTLGDWKDVPGWVSEDESFVIVYASVLDGQPGYYRYDVQQGTLQRLPIVQAAPVEEPEPQPEQKTGAFSSPLTIALAALCVVLALGMLVMSGRVRKLKAATVSATDMPTVEAEQAPVEVSTETTVEQATPEAQPEQEETPEAQDKQE